MLNALYTILICFAFAFIGYSLGCFLFSELLGKAVGKNIRELGSKNPGATNLSRNTSKIYGLCGAFLDAIKSYIAVILALIIFRYSIYYWIPKWWSLIYIAGSFAVIGHCFPLQCIIKKQKGGKGVATAGGVLFSVSPWIGLIAFGIWFITLLISRYVSIASILCMVLAPFCIFITQLDYFYLISNKWFINSHISLVFCNDAKYLLFALIYSNSLLVVFRHQTNLFNLLHKKENKFF